VLNSVNSMPTNLKIAVGASGLSHIRRGVEAWAEESAAALQRAGERAVLFKATGRAESRSTIVLDTMPRSDPRAIEWAALLRRSGLWRVGLSNPYDYEQLAYTVALWQVIGRDYDILHLQDPMAALWMTQLHRAGLSRPRVILAHGTEEPTETLVRYDALQHLAPVQLEDWERHRPRDQKVFAIPNFIDVARFQPADRAAAREKWNLPAGAFVILTVAALKKTHKRIDYLIRETAQLPQLDGRPAYLVMAGARETETPEIEALSRELLGDRGRVLVDVPRAEIASLYHAADVFVLGSLHEMLGIALVEAMACGIPVCCNNSPTLAWVAGGAGHPNDISQPGALAAQLRGIEPADERGRLAQYARRRAVDVFSEQAVIPQFQAMYREVMP
jgi:1,2-diacylglycerol 3-alpha-glucosyltransferase